MSNRPREPIAIIGVACRFPGGVHDANEFWELLRNRVDAISDVPAERWDIRRFHDPDPGVPGKMYTRQAGFLRDRITEFDAQFFGISPREASILDPQQRLLLEATWEAFEDAGVVPQGDVARRTGVYVGGFWFDNALEQMAPHNRHAVQQHTTTSASMVMLSNRVSYVFDLRGPSMTVDTACSSSLVTTHLACQGLWNGECDLALAGGVNVMLRPESTIIECKGGFLSPDARCKAFDASANGYVRGEGVGMVLLKPMSKAVADGDHIYALICATGVNQDGRTPGIAFPNPDSQEALLRTVCQDAGVPPSRVDYVEAHGTGTQAGDPIELRALGTVLANGRPPGDKAWVGSVKTNIGHLEAGAGVAGLIKAALCLKHRSVPPNLHFNHPNPEIDFDALCLRVPKRMEPLPAQREIYAAVNSFGYGGTNANALLRSAPATAPVKSPVHDPERSVLFPLTASSAEALTAHARRVADALAASDDFELADFGYTASQRRSLLPHRLAVAARSKAGLQSSLEAFVRGEHSATCVVGRATAGDPRKLVFAYSGMGAQWWGMGQTLMKSEPVFRRAIEDVDRIFKKYAAWSLTEFFERGAAGDSPGGATFGEAIEEPRIAQPANFALQVALTELWKSYGVEPDAIVGHSVGEISAAWAAGALDLESAVELTFHRSRLQQMLAGKGSMLAVGLSASNARALLADQRSTLSIAAINSPTSVTLAGSVDALQQMAEVLTARGVFQRLLKVAVAYHSSHMDSLEAEFRSVLRNLDSSPAKLPLYSTVTGRLSRAPGDEAHGMHGVDYWWRNSRDAVLLMDACVAIAADGYDAFLEIGAHPVLSAAISESARSAGQRTASVCSTLRRAQDEREALLASLGSLFCQGCRLDWSRFFPSGRLAPLPKYPWQRVEHWKDTLRSRTDRLVNETHPMLHEKKLAPIPTWETELSGQFFPYLKDHCVAGSTVFPGAGYIVCGLAAGVASERGRSLESVVFERPLIVEPTTRLRIELEEREGTITISAQRGAEDPWQVHATGRSVASSLEPRSSSFDLAAARVRCSRPAPVEELYRRLAQRGLDYGPAFRGLKHVACGDGEVLAELACDEAVAGPNIGAYGIHPTLLDAAFQSLIAAIDAPDGALGTLVPARVEQVRLHRDLASHAFVHGRITKRTARAFEGDLVFMNGAGEVLAEVLGLRCQMIAGGESERRPSDDALYAYRWESARREPSPLESRPSQLDRWLVFVARSAVGAQLVNALRDRNQDVVTVEAGERFEITKHGYRIAPEKALEWRELIANLASTPISGAIYLWALDASSSASEEALSGTSDGINVMHLVQALAAKRPRGFRKLSIVTEDVHAVTGDEALKPAAAALWGLGRVIASEHPELGRVCVDVSSADDPRASAAAIAVEVLGGGAEDEVAIRGDDRYVHRLARIVREPRQPIPMSGETPFCLEVLTPGVLDSLTYVETERRKPGRDEIEMRVHATSLNFKDLMKAMNLLPAAYLEETFIGSHLGMECSGVVVAVGENVTHFKVGDPVVAIDTRGSFRSYNTVSVRYAAIQPTPMSFEQSPCLISVVTPYYAFRYIACLQPGDRVLIHSATGGVGLAAVQLAQWMGAEIFATTGSEEKREYLRSLGVQHVMDSRSLHFADEIMERTGGRGVDVVLNSLSGEALRKTWEVLAPYGRYVEIGKRDIASNMNLGLGRFDKNRSFAHVDTDRMGAERPKLFRQIIDEVCELFEQGTLKPLPVTTFKAAEVVDAFRFMARAKHIGKVVIRLGESSDVLVQPKPVTGPTLREDGTYLITGGLGGFGLEVAKWLVSRGARNLVLVGRRGISSEEARAAVRSMQEQGVRVRVAQVDVSDGGHVAALFAALAHEMPVVRGVMHAATALDDGLLNQLDRTRFEAVMRPKATGAWHLHQHTAQLPLDFFVLFSSVSALVGNPGQGSYVAANTFLDALAHYRRARGLPGLSVNWGVIGQVGMVARNAELAKHLERMGMHSFTPQEATSILGELMVEDRAQVGAFEIDWSRYASGAAGRSFAKVPRYAHLTAPTAGGGTGGKFQMRASILEAPRETRVALVQDALCARLSKVMHLPAEKIDVQLSLDNMGMDSLMGMELANALHADVGLELSPMLLMQGHTVAELARVLLEKLEQQDAEERAASESDQADVVDQMSEDELDALLTSNLAVGASV